MADDWQPGDLALCVRARLPLRSGAIYKVEAIHVASDGRLGLFLEGVKLPSISGAAHIYRFRKIRPHTPDAEDAETIRLLTGQPVKEPAA